MHIHAAKDETGSIAPLAIGLASILLATTVTFVDIGALLLFQQRESQQAEALALAVDEAVNAEVLEAAKTNPDLLQAEAGRFAREAGILDYQVGTTDGLTVSASVCDLFKAPIGVPFIRTLGAAGAGQVICATAKARRI